jgi:uncharacterized protein YgiM (DUF1202 family)
MNMRDVFKMVNREGFRWAWVAFLLFGLSGAGSLAAVSTQGSQSVIEKLGKIAGTRVNIRARPTINSEVVTQLNSGDPVTVVDEVKLESPGKDEPAEWSKIIYPTKETMVWVHSDYVTNEGIVTASKFLNVRSGPGENFSKVGELHNGDQIQIVDRADQWIAMAPNKECFAYVASSLLEIYQTKTLPTAIPKPSVATAVPVNKIDSTANDEAGVEATDKPKVAAAESLTEPEVVANPESSKETETVAGEFESATILSVPDGTESLQTEEAEPLADAEEMGVEASEESDIEDTTALPGSDLNAEGDLDAESDKAPDVDVRGRRKVYREGLLGRVVDVQYDNIFRLKSLETNRTMNLLYIAPETEVDLKDYYGRTVWLEGYEGFDPRWPSTPLIIIKTFKVIK